MLWMYPVVHLVSFAVLAILALMARWPIPRWGIALVLVVYAGMTEMVQGVMPPRKAEWGDWIQDLAGIVVGVAICWGIATVVRLLAGSRRAGPGGSSQTADDWEMARSVIVRSAARDPSWWC
jgi:VanZ family protein